jgi:hypothetical protein
MPISSNLIFNFTTISFQFSRLGFSVFDSLNKSNNSLKMEPDIQMKDLRESSSSFGSKPSTAPIIGSSSRTFGRRQWDSFKPAEKAIHSSHPLSAGDDADIENAGAETSDSGLARKLKGRHLQMIAIGGSIGE